MGVLSALAKRWCAPIAASPIATPGENHRKHPLAIAASAECYSRVMVGTPLALHGDMPRRLLIFASALLLGACSGTLSGGLDEELALVPDTFAPAPDAGLSSPDLLVPAADTLASKPDSHSADTLAQPKADTSPPKNAIGESIVKEAMRHQGKPYVYGGAGPSSFDCSGLTMYVIKKALGKNITHSMSLQVAAGKAVSKKSWLPGDLVFFKNTYKAGLSHAGIYIGGGEFIHAENQNTGVKVSKMNSTYYGPRYYGATRVRP